MCYSGKCSYEDHMGECTLVGQDRPFDAECYQAFLAMEWQEMIDDYYRQIGVLPPLPDYSDINDIFPEPF